MGILDKFHESTGYLFVKKRDERFNVNFDTYNELGIQTLESVTRIEKMLNLLESSGIDFQLAPHKFKNTEVIQVIQASLFDKDTFISWGIEEDSVWMTNRTATYKETIKREKEIKSLVDKAAKTIQDRKFVLAWPKALSGDLKKLTEWCNTTEKAAADLKRFIADQPNGQWTSSFDFEAAEKEVSALKNDIQKWQADAQALADEVLKIEVKLTPVSPFADLVKRTEAQRELVRQSMAAKEKTTTTLSKIKKVKDSIEGLTKETPVLKKLKDEVSAMVMNGKVSAAKNARRLSSHAKFRCEKALLKANDIRLTGNPVTDYASIHKAIEDLRSSQRAAKEPYGGYY